MRATNFLLLIFLFLQNALVAQDFVYEPQNPAFGGNPYNYQWLLSSAQAQNTLEDNTKNNDALDRDPLEEFQNSLNRQILNQLSRKLVDNQFGEEEGIKEGSYTIGTFQIDITPSDNGIKVVIFDISTGNETTVIIPYY